MDKSKQGLKFIGSYMKKYAVSLLFVAVFIIASTWLTVISPKIMGNAIDEMSKYVIAQIAQDKQQEMYKNIEDGKGLTDTQKDFIIQNASMDKKTADQFKEATPEQIKSLYSYQKFEIKVIKMDRARIKAGDGFSDKQKEEIQNTDVIEMPMKMMLLNTDAKDLKQTESTMDDLEVSDKQIEDKHKTFMKTMGLLFLSYLCLSVANVIYNVLMALVSSKATRDMRRGLFGKIEELSIRFFDTSNDGDLLSRFTNDIDNISNAMNQTLTQVLSQVAMLIGVIWMMFKEDTSTGTFFGREISNVLTWQMMGFALVAIIIATFIVSKAQFHVSKQQGKLGTLNGYIDESISSQAIVITNDLHEEVLDEFERLNDDYRETSIKGQIYSGIIMPTMNGIGLLNLAVLVFYGAQYVADGAMSVGLLVAFVQYSQRFFQPLGQIFSQYNVLELAVTGAARVKEVFDVKPEVVDKEGAQEIDGINGNVELRSVNFSYIDGKPILKDININVQKGQKIALVGPTGSGKTTVMNLMNRFYDIQSGEILFDGINIQDITLSSLRRNVGIVLQESVLFSGTIAENIAYGKDDATQEEIEHAAKLANVHDFIVTLEDGYETKVTNATNIFSTGQKQLMSIARTILTDPDVLILDEATSNVDTVTEAKIQEAMENVMNGRTSFVIAHRLKTIIDSDEIVVLKDGVIIEQGNHQKLLTEDGFYAELYKNQFVIE